MSRIYTVEFENVAVTASQDFFSIAAVADKPIEIVGLVLAQFSDIGDAAEEILRYRIIRGHDTVGSGGTAPTPRPCRVTNAAAGFTARVNDTTIASAGTAVNLFSDAFNIRTGVTHWFPPGCEPSTAATATNEFMVVRLLSTPTDSLSMSGTLFVREM